MTTLLGPFFDASNTFRSEAVDRGKLHKYHRREAYQTGTALLRFFSQITTERLVELQQLYTRLADASACTKISVSSAESCAEVATNSGTADLTYHPAPKGGLR